ncbi:MAG: amidase [Caulobacteraceae bacterium]|nr:amidase [Caulobacteraceae bacterium]
MPMNRRAFMATAAAAPMAAAAPSVSAMARDLAWIDATETAALIRRREISAAEAVGGAIDRAKALNPELNFMVTPDFERAKVRAQSPAGEPGPFAGAPIFIKDLQDLEGVPTRYGSRSGARAGPAARNSDRVTGILAAGFNPIGKSATPEFGFLPTTEPLATGPTRNPWDPERSCGGSSGGAAVAVASGVLPLSHATDGGGSIRIPAACCGLVGLKPTRGRIIGDETGVTDLSVSLCVSRTVRDTAAFLASVERAGADRLMEPVGLVSRPSTRKLKIGFLKVDPLGHAATAEVGDAVTETALLLESLGHDAHPLERWPLDASHFTEDFSNLWAEGGREVFATIERLAGPGMAERTLEPFTLALAAQRGRIAQADFEASVGRLIGSARQYLGIYKNYDVILTPVLDQPAVPLGYVAPDVPMETLVERLTTYVGYTPLNNIAGSPSLSLPLFMSQAGLPIGMMFSADVGQDRLLLELAYQLESARPWIARRPAVHA